MRNAKWGERVWTISAERVVGEEGLRFRSDRGDESFLSMPADEVPDAEKLRALPFGDIVAMYDKAEVIRRVD
jgi:hypothetical protein